MARSMTGFGRARFPDGAREFLVEIKSVNHRFFEFSARTPRGYGYLDDKLKSLVSGAISRGKTEVSVLITSREGADAQISINRELARGYVEALRPLGEELSLRDDLSLSAIARLPDVFVLQKADEDEDAVWDAVRTAAEEALASFVAMRATEGERLTADLRARLDTLEDCTGKVEELSPRTTAAYRERLEARLREVLEGKGIDEARILTEAAIFADKVAVDEETVRLRSHIRQFREMLESPEPVGRKLDFLTQELNRETNTIGSKCQDLEVTGLVLRMKGEIEKIREQIQNLE